MRKLLYYWHCTTREEKAGAIVFAAGLLLVALSIISVVGSCGEPAPYWEETVPSRTFR